MNNYKLKIEISTIIVLCVFILISYFFPYFENEFVHYEKDTKVRIQLIKIPPTAQSINKKGYKNLKPFIPVESDQTEILDSIKTVKKVRTDSFYFSYMDLHLPWKDLSKFDPSKLIQKDSTKNMIAGYKQYLKQKPWLTNYNQYDFRDNQFYIPQLVAEYKMNDMGREANVLSVTINPVAVLNTFSSFFKNNKKLTLDNILKSRENFYLLTIFWEHNPLTIYQLYKNEIVKEKNSYNTLTKSMDLLMTAGLVKIVARSVDKDYYTASYSKSDMVDMINKFLFEVKGKNKNKYDELNKILNQIVLYN